MERQAVMSWVCLQEINPALTPPLLCCCRCDWIEAPYTESIALICQRRSRRCSAALLLLLLSSLSSCLDRDYIISLGSPPTRPAERWSVCKPSSQAEGKQEGEREVRLIILLISAGDAFGGSRGAWCCRVFFVRLVPVWSCGFLRISRATVMDDGLVFMRGFWTPTAPISLSLCGSATYRWSFPLLSGWELVSWLFSVSPAG